MAKKTKSPILDFDNNLYRALKEIVNDSYTYELIQTNLVQEFGDEGHDIGDACDWQNLVSHTCDFDAREDRIGVGVDQDAHNSFTSIELCANVADTICVPVEHVYAFYLMTQLVIETARREQGKP